VKKRSDKTRIISTRRAVEIIDGAIHSWTVDTIASTGASRGVGACFYGSALVRAGAGGFHFTRADQSQESFREGEVFTVAEDYVDLNNPEKELSAGSFLNGTVGIGHFKLVQDVPDTPAQFQIDGETTKNGIDVQSTSTGLARSHLITIGEANRALEHAASVALGQFYARLRQTARKRYRRHVVYRRARRRMAALVEITKETLHANCYPAKRKRKGVQCISTSRARSTMPVGQWFKFNGKPAWRQPRGRPPLPAAEWMRRYKARRAMAKKTTRTIQKWGKRVPVVGAPALSGKGMKQRPKTILKLKKCGRSLRDILLGNVEAAPIDEFYTGRELSEETLLAGFPDGDWESTA